MVPTITPLLAVALVAFVAAAPAASLHDDGCRPGAADLSTYLLYTLPGGRVFYEEERDNGLGSSPPPPGSGFLFGGGTWFYEETNGIDAPWGSLQRGTYDPQCLFPPPPPPCLVIDADPVHDDHCGHGPDTLIL